jgi:hypothetical protein
MFGPVVFTPHAERKAPKATTKAAPKGKPKKTKKALQADAELEGEIVRAKAAIEARRAAAPPSRKIVVYIDTRERRNDDLRASLATGANAIAEVRTLAAGDLWITLDGRLLYLFERKSLQDLSNSIGGRTAMQKFKQKGMLLDSWRVVYLIEGQERSRYMKGESSLVGAQVDNMVRDRQCNCYTLSSLGTVFYVLKTLLKCYEHADYWADSLQRFPACDTSFDPLLEQKVPTYVLDDAKLLAEYKTQIQREYLASYKPAPNAVRCPYTAYVQQLRQFYNLGDAKAQALARVFPTMVELASFAANPHIAEADKVTMMGNIVWQAADASPAARKAAQAEQAEPSAKRRKTQATTPRGKRLGKVLAKRILAWLHGRAVEPTPKKAAKKPPRGKGS